MSTITLRSTKGSALTNAEVDANFTNLNTDKLQLGSGSTSSVANQVTYFNASNQLAQSSNMSFDGSNLSIGSSNTTSAKFSVFVPDSGSYVNAANFSNNVNADF